MYVQKCYHERNTFKLLKGYTMKCTTRQLDKILTHLKSQVVLSNFEVKPVKQKVKRDFHFTLKKACCECFLSQVKKKKKNM